MKWKPLRPVELGQPRLFQRRIVIIVEIVEPDHLMSQIEQLQRGKEADEARGACNQNSHDAHRIKG